MAILLLALSLVAVAAFVAWTLSDHFVTWAREAPDGDSGLRLRPRRRKMTAKR